jgi:hippurate hydrolase
MPELRETLLDEARGELERSVALRRRLHERPELGLVLPETQRAVLEALGDLDLEIATGGETSAVVATLRGARPGPTILLRADMDALPMREETDLPFASREDGRMHACGHDAHVAMLAGAARLLARRRAEFAGTVKLLFQPGEEGHAC